MMFSGGSNRSCTGVYFGVSQLRGGEKEIKVGDSHDNSNNVKLTTVMLRWPCYLYFFMFFSKQIVSCSQMCLFFKVSWQVAY